MLNLLKFFISLIFLSYIILLIVLFGGLFYTSITNTWDGFIYRIAIVVIMAISVGIVYYFDREKKSEIKIANKEKEQCLSEQKKRELDFNKRRRELEKLFDEMKRATDELEAEYNKAMKSSNPFSHVAEMFADWETIVYEKTAYFMRTKPHPAIRRAEEIKELKEKTRVHIREFKEMKYKYLFLLDVFPELKNYVDDAEALKHLSDYKDYGNFKAERDEVLDWISPEEYKSLSEDERNQLALDRYKRAKKSDWQIGMQYEMYIGYLLRKSGWNVVQYGVENGLNDLGRDIIATRMENGIVVTYIVQCKNWSINREIHENVVCQLYGTTIQYELTHRGLFNKVVPVLVITNNLSEIASKFAKRLGVMVLIRPLGDYPMIKCNINNEKKIYHLPFDQQYYRTQIKLPGEFYASTVKEAVEAGFRRAKRHMFNQS